VALSNLFDYAFKIGATPDNPLLTIEKPRIKRARPAVLDDEEYEALLNRALTQRRFDVLSWLVLGGLVGLRPYEVLRLEWTGIHFQTREIVSNQDGRKRIERESFRCSQMLLNG
jgi:integrase